MNAVKKQASAGARTPLPIVAIGASAGGLEALEGFFSHTPSDSNMCFIVIQHLDPKHKSIMASLLAKSTRMKIFEVENGMRVEPNCIYLNPPNHNMSLENGKLKLIELAETHALNFPIDFFFKSLDPKIGSAVVCLILSGTGTDGTRGVKAVKEAGGMIMAQDAAQAKYDGMPLSAIETGMVDFVLPVEKMPETLIKYVRHPFLTAHDEKKFGDDLYRNDLGNVFYEINAQTGHDFSEYKLNTINRRIERRMVVNQIEHISEYVKYLKINPDEVPLLFKDILISVTSFFRDSDSFEMLKDSIRKLVIDYKDTVNALRCWIPGCATGEEAYSIAILFFEAIKDTQKKVNLLIFATDTDEDAIDKARAGVYPDSIAADISADRLERFFTREGNTYRVNRKIRQSIIFATHDLIKDPPFSQLSLVSCRNLLIYLNPALQKKILPLFHYILCQGGILFLGSSESVSNYTDLFTPISKSSKIFLRSDANSGGENLFPRLSHHQLLQSSHRTVQGLPAVNVNKLVHKILLDDYSPSCVLINSKFEILFFGSDTNKFLSNPVGEPSFNVLQMIRDEFRLKLESAIQKVIKTGNTIKLKNLWFKRGEEYLSADLIVRPINEPQSFQKLFLILFDEKSLESPGEKEEKPSTGSKAVNLRVSGLEQELKATKDYLQTTIEAFETNIEELKSANEELQSTNEELQSSNEELVTSKEELQSTNEELITVNSELQDKIKELNQANNDINNLLSNTDIGTIFLDEELCIKRFTPAMTRIFNLIKTDIKRSILDITGKFATERLFEDAQKVLDTLIPIESELLMTNGEWYSVRISPYRTLDNLIDGVVVTFKDISRIKEAEKLRRLVLEINDASDAVTIQDLKGSIKAWNNGAVKMYGYSKKEALAMNMKELIPDDKMVELQELMKRVKKAKRYSPSFQFGNQKMAGKKRSGSLLQPCTVKRERSTLLPQLNGI